MKRHFHRPYPGALPGRIEVSPYPHLWEVLTQICATPALPRVSTEPGASAIISIRFMLPGERARHVVRRSNSGMTGKFPSRKREGSGKPHFESQHELDAMCILEAFPDVITYQEQPACIQYRDDAGVICRHYPDILAVLGNGQRLLLEIKSDSEASDPDLEKRTMLLTPALRLQGIGYMVVAASQLGGAYLANSHKIRLAATDHILPQTREHMRMAFDRSSMTLGNAIAAASFVTDDPKGLVYGLVMEGTIRVPMASPLVPDTPVLWKKGA